MKKIKKKIEVEQKARELVEQQEREKLQCLLDEAKALQQVNTIRNYVKSIQENIKDISVSKQEIKRWAFWDLEQADRIDPVKTLSFLNYKKYENSSEENNKKQCIIEAKELRFYLYFKVRDYVFQVLNFNYNNYKLSQFVTQM